MKKAIFLLISLIFSISLSKIILFVDSSLSISGSGSNSNDPLNKIEFAFRYNDDLEIILINSSQPYIVESSHQFTKSFKLTSLESRKASLSFSEKASLIFFSNVTLTNLLITSKKHDGVAILKNEILIFGGAIDNKFTDTETSFLGLEFEGFTLNNGRLISGALNGSIILKDIIFRNILSQGNYGAFLINMIECSKIFIEGLDFSGLYLNEGGLIYLSESAQVKGFEVRSSIFNSTASPETLIIMTKSAVLTNLTFTKNLFVNYKILEALGPNGHISINSLLLAENSETGNIIASLIFIEDEVAKLTVLNSKIMLNYAPNYFIYLSSKYSMCTFSNVSIIQNIYPLFLYLNGPSIAISIMGVYFQENNDSPTLYSLLYNNSRLIRLSDSFGYSISINDYISIMIKNLTFQKNRAKNTLQGLGLKHSENFTKEFQVLAIKPEATISEFKCIGNSVYINKSPNLIGACLNIAVTGILTISLSNFMSNEVSLDITQISAGASSPCIYSSSVNPIELSVIDSIFDNNRGFDGSHCVTFLGEYIFLFNTNFTNIGGLKVEASRRNKAGALSISVRFIEILNVFLISCSAHKASGILFQNSGNLKEIILMSSDLTIRGNRGDQSAGIEFDSFLPNGLCIFNRTIIDSNRVHFYGTVLLNFNSFINITFLNSQFLNNCGNIAGSLFTLLNLDGILLFVGSKFFNNSLTGDQVYIGGSVAFVNGGALYTNIIFQKCYFLRNFCSRIAGAIALRIGRLNISDSIFEENSASIGGCLTVSYSSRALVMNSSFFGGAQDVLIQEAAAVFVNDESYTVLTNCNFINLKAKATAAIKHFSGSSELNIYSSSFIGNQAEQGSIITVINNFLARTIYFMDILFQGNINEAELIYIKNVMIIANNFSAIQNKGKLFMLIQLEFNLRNFHLFLHECPRKNDQGCFAYISEGKNLVFENGNFFNISSGFERDFFIIKESNVVILFLKYTDVRSYSEFALAYVISSTMTLISAQISNLANSLLYIESSSIKITASAFENISIPLNASYKYGAIQCLYCSQIEVSYSNFRSFINTGSLGGVFSFLKGKGSEENFVIMNNNFLGNSAQSGGVIYAETQSLIFINNSVRNGKAQDKGGAAFLKSVYQAHVTWLIKDNIFENNEAKSGGCVHSLGNIPKGIYDNFYLKNKAIYGNDYSSFAVRLTIESNINNEFYSLNCTEMKDNCSIKNVSSGLSLKHILISIIDAYGQKMVLEETIGSIELAYKKDYSEDFGRGREDIPNLLSAKPHLTLLKGIKSVRSVKGIFNFSELTLIGTPKSKIILMAKMDLINIFMPEFIPKSSIGDQANLISNEYNFLFLMEIGDCVRGELYIKEENICYPCPPGKYSLNVNDTECKRCPLNAVCEGRDRIIVSPGFWRSSVDSSEIWPCNIVSDPCLGGYESLCKEGYTATICGACQYEVGSKKYFKNGLFFCYPCEEMYKYIIVLAIGIFLLLFLFIFLIWKKLRKPTDIREGALLKLLINHIQVISLISNIKITLPNILQNFYSIQGSITSTEAFVFAIDCFRDMFTIPIYAAKILISVAITLFIILILSLTFYCIKKLKKKTTDETFINILNSFVIVAMFIQPQFINFYVQMLSCAKYERFYLVNYLDQVCWDTEHLIYSFFFTVPMLVFWVIIYPGSFLLFLVKNRNNLNKTRVLRLTAFFRAGYRNNRYYWEFVIMSRKFLIILITGFLGNETEVVIYLVIPLISFYCALQIYVRPFIESKFNLLEFFSLNVSFITWYSAVFYLKIASWSFRLFFMIIILGSNGAFFLLWLYHYILKFRSKQKPLPSLGVEALPYVFPADLTAIRTPAPVKSYLSETNRFFIKCKFSEKKEIL